MPSLQNASRATFAVLLAALAAACGEGPPSAAEIAANSSTTTESPVGVSVSQKPSVIVRDSKGNPFPGYPVVWAVTSGGGNITRATDTTDENGLADPGSWAIGTVAGTNTLTASAQGLTGSPVTFTVTGTAGAPNAIIAEAGNNQTAVAGTAVATLPAAKVVDIYGNGVAGLTVTFAVGSGGGSVTGATATTNASGVATPGSWTLGPTVGANALTANYVNGAINFLVQFDATATAGAAARIVVSRQPTGAASGSVIARQPILRVTDANGNLVSTATTSVTAAIASGGGTLGGTATRAAVNGIVTFTDLAVTGTGATTLAFSAAGLTGATSSSFTVAAPAGPATQLGISTQPAGAISAVAFATQPEIELRDASGTVVSAASAAVTASIASGTGTLSGTTTVNTVNGIATFTDLRITGSGNSTIAFSATGLTGVTSQTVAVAPPAVLTYSLFTGDRQAVMAGGAVPVKPAIRAIGTNNVPVAGARVTFSVGVGGGSVTGATVLTDANGVATVGNWTTGAGGGYNTLVANVENVTGASTSVVFAASGCFGSGAGYRLTLCFTSEMSTTQRAAFTSAASRWETVVTNDPSDETLTQAIPGTSCGSGGFTLASGFAIDDLLIFASIVPIDGVGAVLGSAGACFLRQASPSAFAVGDFTIIGQMRFDSDDMAGLESTNRLNSVILHEMGHVIGIGSLWGVFGFTKNPSTATSQLDTYFDGANAVAGFNAIGFSTYTGNKVPVENTGGAGTINSHWRETILSNELMTGFISGASNPLSLLTVRSLQDLGYTVNTGAADAYPAPPPASLLGVSMPPLHLGNDVYAGPLFGIDRRGRITRIR